MKPLSHSQIVKYAQCGEAYRRAYILKERGPSGLPALAGNAMHEAVEVWEQADDLDLYQVARGILSVKPDVNTARHYGKEDLAWWLSTGLRNLSNAYVARRATEKIQMRALEYDFQHDGVRAIIDQVYENGGVLVARDLKTGKKKRDHILQMELYIWLYNRSHAEKIQHGALLYLDKKKGNWEQVLVWSSLDDNYVDQFKRAIAHNIFPPTGPFNDACGMCDFIATCSYGQAGEVSLRKATN